METTKSLEIIEAMMSESRKSLHRNSFYFLLWGILLVPAGIAEYLFRDMSFAWFVWPVVGVVGGIISMIYGNREAKRTGVQTSTDRITYFTWGAFLFGLAFSIVYAVSNNMMPHALILAFTAVATFISGGISKFQPFIWGGILIGIGAIICGFVLPGTYHPLVFSAAIFLGYVIPGLQLRKKEHE